MESPANPSGVVVDIQEICKIAKEHNIISMIDNTIMTPIL
jgi:cystathionine beta-lyase/cystathionine gamma-synthase